MLRLPSLRRNASLPVMSATEVIEQIKALPSEERRQVVDFVRSTPHQDAASETQRPAIRQVAGEIFDRYEAVFRKLAE